MTTTTSTAAALVVNAEIAALFVQPLLAASIAAQVATTVTISAGSLRVPRVKTDPSAGWVREGEEIPVTDAVLDEIEVVPAKLAGLTVITRELADDSNPQAGEIVGQGLARDCAKKLDLAFFGAVAAPAPAGLGSLAGVTVVTAGSSWSSVDPFTEGLYAAAGRSAAITAWVANPVDALALARIKQSSTSNVALLQPDATAGGRSLIGGVSLLTSTAVPAGSVYGIDPASAYLVLRDDVNVETDGSAFFTSDRIAVRARARAGFGFPDPAAIVRVELSA